MAKKLNGLLSGHPLDCCDYWSIWRAKNKREISFFKRIVIFIFWNVKWYATTQRFGLDLCPLTVHAQCLHPLPWCTVDNPRYNVHQFMAHTVRKVCILSLSSLGSALIPMSPPHPARTKNFSKMVMMMMVMTLVMMIMPRSLRRLYNEYPESYLAKLCIAREDLIYLHVPWI